MAGSLSGSCLPLAEYLARSFGWGSPLTVTPFFGIHVSTVFAYTYATPSLIWTLNFPVTSLPDWSSTSILDSSMATYSSSKSSVMPAFHTRYALSVCFRSRVTR